MKGFKVVTKLLKHFKSFHINIFYDQGRRSVISSGGAKKVEFLR